VDFRNTVVIMTSNLGSDRIQELAQEGATYNVIKNEVMQSVNRHFRPEFINRIDEIVVFHPLGREHIHNIARLQLARLQQRLAERDMKLEVTEAALDIIAEAGYDPVYGARPLKRAIQHLLEEPLAIDILAGKFGPEDTIIADAEDGKIVFRKG